MTPSLARNEKGRACVGRCLFATALPQRHPCRVSNLVPHAGVVSNPRATSGPADSSYIFAPPGQLLSVQPCRPTGGSLPRGLDDRGDATRITQAGSSPWRRRAPFLHLTLRHEPGSQAPREGSESRPVIGVFHGSTMKDPSHEDVASAYVNARS